MRNCFSVIILAMLFGLTAGSVDVFAQSPYYEEADTTKRDTVEQEGQEGTEEEGPESVLPETDDEVLAKHAVEWCRRYLLRGFPDFSTSGSWATYSETDWGKSTGSYGPVIAHFTVNYLGPTSWLGTTAEHLQFVYRTLEPPKRTIEIDAIVEANEKVTTIHRLIYRIDKGDLVTADVSVPEGQLDYDKLDKPTAGEKEELRLYSGTWDATIYAGSGSNATKVYTYRVADLPPMNIVVLGYGDMGLTYRSGGDDAEPRFEAPAPTTRK